MKNKLLFGMFFLLAATFAACKSDKKVAPAEEVAQAIVFTAEDTAEINTLVENYITSFKGKDLEVAASMLYNFRNDSIIPFTDAEKASYKQAFASMPVYECRRKSVILRDETNNEVRLAIQFVSSGSIDEGRGVTYISLNPVLKDGKWHLTMLKK